MLSIFKVAFTNQLVCSYEQKKLEVEEGGVTAEQNEWFKTPELLGTNQSLRLYTVFSYESK